MTAQTTVQGFRLSPQQVRVWSLQQATPELPLQAWCSVRLRGPLDRGALAEALACVAGRHEILRTTFRVLPEVGLPVQVVGEGAAVAPAFRDLATIPAHEVAGEEAAWLDSLGVDLRGAGGPPLRAALFRRGDQDHAFYLALSAACADARTLDNLVGQVGAAYTRIAGGAQPEPDDAVQYVDFSEWVNEMLASDEARDGRGFWSGRSSPTAAALLDSWPAGVNGGGRTATHHRALPPVLSRQVGEAARAHGVGTAAWLLAAWQVLLSRHAGGGEVTVRVGVEGRTYPEFQGSLGPFAKYVPVPGHVREGEPFSVRVAEVDSALAESRSWQDFYAWNPSATEGDARPGFGFDYAETPAEEVRGGVAWSLERRWHQTDRFALRLSVERAAESGILRATLYYDAATQSAEGAVRLLRRYERLLEDTVRAPGTRADSLALADDGERNEVLVRWNATAVEFPVNVPVHHAFEARAARTPGAIALGFDGGTVTFGALDERANRIAHGLRARGVGPDTRVGLLLERSPEMIACILAVLKAGGAYVPLDPGYPADRLRFIAENGALALVIASAGLERRFGGESAVGLVTVSELEGAAGSVAGRPDVQVGPRNAAYVLYTSGSTGTPKGVVVEHGGLSNQMSWMQLRFPLDAGDVVLQKTPFVFDASVWEILAPLLAGARLELAPPGSHADGAYLADAVGRLDVTTLQVVPSQLHLVLASGGFAGWTALRRLFTGGEALTAALRGEILGALPGVELVNLYGPTETTVQVAYWECAADEKGPVPIGVPISNARLYVLDNALRPVPAGVRGELYVGGAGVSRGYMARPGFTAERFIPDEFGGEPGARLYRSGDVARWRSDGALEYLGRVDGQVKVRGYRVETGEIEAVLERHPAVRAAAVVVRGEAGAERLAAYWTPAAAATPDQLRAHLSEHLPPYMVPGAIVELEAFPLLPSGKVDRRALPDPEEASAIPFEAAANAIEEVLALVWAEILGVERVGVNDNFFALGGDSILSVRIVGMARDRGLRLSVQDVFEHQTVRALARRAEQGSGEAVLIERVLDRDRQPFDLIPEADRAGLPRDAVDAYPLSALQSGMLYHQALTPDAPAYHNVNSYHFRGPWDESCFRTAVQRAVDTHENLRTSIHLSGFSQMLQVVHAHAEVPIQVEDIRHLPEDEQQRYLDAFRRAEFAHLPDLTRAPLMWLHVHRRADDRFQLTLTECHAIADGWSTTSLFADVFEDYAALVRGAPLPERTAPPVRFRDFVEMERDTAASDESRRFWEERLAAVEMEPLPRIPPATPVATATGVVAGRIPVTPELEAALQALARSLAVPLKSVLMSAHLKVLGLLTGSREVGSGLVTNGRPEVSGGTDVRGLFLNTVPLALHLGHGSWRELVYAVLRAETEMLPHRRYPLARLRQGRGARLPESSLTLVNFHGFAKVVREGVLEVLDNSDLAETSYPLRMTAVLHPVTSRISSLSLRVQPEVASGARFQWLLHTYRRVLESIAADPEDRHDDFDALEGEERARMLEAWNRTEAAIPAQCVHELFAGQAARTPDAVAVASGAECLTYAGLDDRAARLAARLRRHGVGPERRVAICLDPSVEMVVAVLAVLKAGGAFVPLDPEDPPGRTAMLLEDSEATVLLARAAPELPPHRARVLLVDGEEEGADEPLPALPAVPAGLAAVIYTSGSTGRPRGVMVTHRSISNHLAWINRDVIGPEVQVLPATTRLAFDASFKQVLGPLVRGGTVWLVPPGAARDPGALLRSLPSGRNGAFNGVPSFWAALLDAAGADADALRGTVTRVLLGGEALSAELAARTRAVLPDAEIWNLYGPTETTVNATAWRVDDGPVRIGMPAANTRAYVLDADLRPAPAGVPGELCIAGEGVARGYLGDPARTAERFVPEPFSGGAGSRMYRTGDRARWHSDGTLEFLGRADDQVKIRGFRVETGEVEAALERHPAVMHAAALVRRDPPGHPRLVAYAVPRPDAAVTEEEARRHLRGILPPYMVPAAVVVLDAMPRTAGGKVDRRALPAPVRERGGGAAAAPAETGMEARVATLWEALLGVEAVGVEENFFDLGGHSLLLVALQNRLRAELGREVPLVELFQHSTVRSLAAHLQGRGEEGAVLEGEERGLARQAAATRRTRVRGLRG